MSKAIAAPHQFNRPVRAFMNQVTEACKEMLRDDSIKKKEFNFHFMLNGKDLLKGIDGNPPKVELIRRCIVEPGRDIFEFILVLVHIENVAEIFSNSDELIHLKTRKDGNTLHFATFVYGHPVVAFDSPHFSSMEFCEINHTLMAVTGKLLITKPSIVNLGEEGNFTNPCKTVDMDIFEVNDLYINLNRVIQCDDKFDLMDDEVVLLPFRDFLFLVANQRLSLTRYPEGNEVTYLTEEEYKSHVDMKDYINKMSTNVSRLEHIQKLRDDNLTRMSEDIIIGSPNGGRQHFAGNDWHEKGFTNATQFTVEYKNHSSDDTYLMGVEMSTDIPCISVFPKPVMNMLSDMTGIDISSMSLKPYQVIELGEKCDYILSHTIKNMPFDRTTFYPFDLGIEDQYITMKTTLGNMKGLRDPADGNRQRFVLCQFVTENDNVFKGIEVAIQYPVFQAHLETFSIDISFPEIVEKLKNNPSNLFNL